MGDCELVCVDPLWVYEVWPQVDGMIRRAMERVGISDHKVLTRQVLNGEALLWVAWDGAIRAAVVTQIGSANGRKLCTIVACGGTGCKTWVGFMDGIEDYARREGCAAMIIMGRNGWSRVLPAYRQRAVVLEKEL